MHLDCSVYSYRFFRYSRFSRERPGREGQAKKGEIMFWIHGVRDKRQQGRWRKRGRPRCTTNDDATVFTHWEGGQLQRFARTKPKKTPRERQREAKIVVEDKQIDSWVLSGSTVPVGEGGMCCYNVQGETTGQEKTARNKAGKRKKRSARINLDYARMNYKRS